MAITAECIGIVGTDNSSFSPQLYKSAEVISMEMSFSIYVKVKV